MKIFKRCIVWLLVLCTLLSVSGLEAFAATLTLPSQLKAIDAEAFYGDYNVTDVAFNDGVESIGPAAFLGTAVKNVLLPSTVTSIGESAFAYCYWLQHVSMSNSVTEIEDYTFYDCYNMTEIELPRSLTRVGEGAFDRCTSLQAVYFEGTETEWNSIAIENGNESLQQATVFYEQDYGDKSCGDNLQWALIGNTLVVSGIGAMYDYEGFNDSSIPNYAPWHNYNDSIEIIMIENGVSRIGSYAFYQCTNASVVTLPDSLTSIGIGAFYQCEALGELHLPDSISSMGENAFYRCPFSEINYPRSWRKVETVRGDSETEFNIHQSPFFQSGVTTVVIPEGITDIPSYAFGSMEELTSVAFPSTLQTIGYDAFSDTGITELNIVAPNLCSIARGAFVMNHQLMDVRIVGNLESIGKLAFAECEQLTHVDIPDTVYEIDDGAFQGCINLLSMEMPESFSGDAYQLFGEAGDSIYGCSLKTVFLPAGIESVRFLEGTALETVFYRGTEEQWAELQARTSDTNPAMTANVIFGYGPALTLPTSEDTVTAEEQDYVLVFQAASTGWTMTCDSDWVTALSNVVENGVNSVRLHISANQNAEMRSAVINFNCADDEESFYLRQFGAVQNGDFMLSESQWLVGSYNSEMRSFTVSSLEPWTLTECPEWITPSVTGGENGAELSLRCDFYTSKDGRSGMLTFKSGEAVTHLYVWQPGTGTLPSVVGVTLPQGTPDTEEELTLTVNTRNADEVQLVVDGIPYEKYPVYDNTSNIKRVFHSGGDRSVQFIPFCNGEAGISSPIQVLTLETSGPLSAPFIHPISDVLCGDGVTLKWDPVENATNYTIYFSDGRVFLKLGETSDLSYPIDSNMLTELGDYSVEVIATAKGWSQRGSTLDFKVISPIVDFSIISPTVSAPYEAHDKMYFTIANPSNRHVRIKVTCGSNIWYEPKYGAESSTQPIITFEPPAKGTYTASVVAYSSSGVVADELYWGESSPKFTFYVSAGIMESVSVRDGKGGTEYLAKNTALTFFARGKKTLKTVNVYHNSENTPFLVLHAPEDDSGIDGNSRRNLSDIFATGFPEGYHSFKFVGIDRDGVETTLTRNCYVISDYDVPKTCYPKNSAVILRMHAGKTSDDDVTLPVSQAVTVYGTYGMDLCYVETTMKGETVRGFVQADELSDVQLTDLTTYRLGDLYPAYGMELYDLSIPHDYTLNWKKGDALPANGGYNVYLVCTEPQGNYESVKLNDSYLRKESVTFSSLKLHELMSQLPGSWTRVCLKVDLIDTSTKQVVKTVWHPDDDDYMIIVLGRASEEALIHRVDLAVQSYTGVHDILRYGSYTYDGKVYEGKSVRDLMLDGATYSIITGNANDLNLDPGTRGCLMADAIMNELSTGEMDLFNLSDLDLIMDAIGLGIDFKDFLQSIGVQELRTLHLKNPSDKKALADYLSAADDHFETAQWRDKFEENTHTFDVVDIILRIIEDGVNFSSVSKDDVKKYVNAFRDSKDPSLQVCACALEIMTQDKLSLYSYLAAAYGCSYAIELINEFAYESITLGFPVEWKLTIKAASLFNDYSFNTTKMLAAAYDLEAVTAMTQEYCDSFRRAFKSFRDNPTKESYDNLLAAAEVYAGLMRCEVEKFNQFAIEANSGAMAILCNAIARKETPQMDIDTLSNTLSSSFISSMEACYATLIRPYV